MKKKKLNGLSLNKNVISRLSSVAIIGGTGLPEGTRYCQEVTAALPCFSKDCEVKSVNLCELTEQNCGSIQVHCF